jgi:hypothetical protein
MYLEMDVHVFLYIIIKERRREREMDEKRMARALLAIVAGYGSSKLETERRNNQNVITAGAALASCISSIGKK